MNFKLKSQSQISEVHRKINKLIIIVQFYTRCTTEICIIARAISLLHSHIQFHHGNLQVQFFEFKVNASALKLYSQSIVNIFIYILHVLT